MQLSIGSSLENFLSDYPKAVMMNFSKEILSENSDVSTVVIGCEGGFSSHEVALFTAENIMGLNTPLILKSESAVCAVASKILL